MPEAFATKNKPHKQASSVDALKVPPYSVEAEQSVIGGLMLDNEAWDKISHKVQEDDFYRIEHRLIFKVLTELARRSQPFDVITMTEALKAIDELDNAGGELYLFELANNTPSVANIVAYADIVREKSVLRQLIGVAGDIADSAFHPDGRDVSELLDTAESKVFAIAEQTAQDGGPQTIASLLTKAVERVDTLFHSKEAITGLPTGFTDLDQMTSGLQPSDLVIVAGRPSMGKTAFAMNIAENAAITSKKPVLVFSLEMSGDQLAMRMMSSLGRIDQQRLRTGRLTDEDWPRITSSVSMLSEASMYIDDTPSISPSELRSRARRIAKEQGQLGLIVIDYLQKMLYQAVECGGLLKCKLPHQILYHQIVIPSHHL